MIERIYYCDGPSCAHGEVPAHRDDASPQSYWHLAHLWRTGALDWPGVMVRVRAHYPRWQRDRAAQLVEDSLDAAGQQHSGMRTPMSSESAPGASGTSTEGR